MRPKDGSIPIGQCHIFGGVQPVANALVSMSLLTLLEFLEQPELANN